MKQQTHIDLGVVKTMIKSLKVQERQAEATFNRFNNALYKYEQLDKVPPQYSNACENVISTVEEFSFACCDLRKTLEAYLRDRKALEKSLRKAVKNGYVKMKGYASTEQR